MVAAELTTNTPTANMEMKHPAFELVQFTSQSKDGDFYDPQLLNHVDAAFAAQQTTDNQAIKVAHSKQSNGVDRVTVTPETTDATTGWLVIVGRQ